MLALAGDDESVVPEELRTSVAAGGQHFVGEAPAAAVRVSTDRQPTANPRDGGGWNERAQGTAAIVTKAIGGDGGRGECAPNSARAYTLGSSPGPVGVFTFDGTTWSQYPKRLVLVSALGDRYRVRVKDDGSVVGLWRRRPIGHAIGPPPGVWVQRAGGRRPGMSLPTIAPPRGSRQRRPARLRCLRQWGGSPFLSGSAAALRGSPRDGRGSDRACYPLAPRGRTRRPMVPPRPVPSPRRTHGSVRSRPRHV